MGAPVRPHRPHMPKSASVRSIVISRLGCSFVSQFVHSHISEITRLNFKCLHMLSVAMALSSDDVATCDRLCTSGFADDVLL